MDLEGAGINSYRTVHLKTKVLNRISKRKTASIDVTKMINRGLTRLISACFLALVFFLSVALTSVKHPTRYHGPLSWTLKYRRAISPIQSELTGSITCNRSRKNYDLCSINRSVLLDPITFTFSILHPTKSTPPNLTMKTHPYPRKKDETALSTVKELTLTSSPPKFPCGVIHNSPALVFSAGGYTGNFFHEFNDGFVPLYITVDSLFSDKDVILVITDCNDWWAKKYADLLPHFTSHPIINIDNQTTTTTHCFPSVTVGLIKHGPMTVDSTLLPHPKTLVNFQEFLNNVYSNRGKVLAPNKSSRDHDHRPRLVLVNRKGDVGRVIMNLKQVKNAIKGVGFELVVFEPERDTPLVDSFKLIHESHAMVAVHGAAITHFLFQRPGAVLGEIVPIGTKWVARNFFEKPARVLGLEYMKYEVGVEESSLVEKYGTDSLVVKNPEAFTGGNWTKARVYMKTQNVKLDIVRFRRFLKTAFEKAKRFMDKER